MHNARLGRRATLFRRLRSSGGRWIRRLGLLPGGMPDGLGDDDKLLGSRVDQEVIVYFPDTTGALYQLEQWYAALRALNEVHKVLFVLQDSRTAARVRQDSGLPAVTIAHYGTLDDVLGRSGVRMAFYVNHNPLNFSMLRFTSLVHVSLLHGDSDKTVSVSNQIKAYDFSFVAGQAAIDRVVAHTALFDPARCLPIGRASLDAELLEGRGSMPLPRPPVAVETRPTILYAPSWEGAQPSAFYGSVLSHGSEIVSALLASSRFRVIYRPHPLSGVRLGAYGDADAGIREQIRGANLADSQADHRVDVNVPLLDSFDEADLLICDVSAVPMEWLPTKRPIVMTVPSSDDVVVAKTPLSEVLPRLDVTEIAQLARLVETELTVDPNRKRRIELIDYYVGDTAPGASVKKFLAACDHVLALRDAEWDRVRANGAIGP